MTPQWVHIQYPETAQFREVYGFAGSQGMVNLEGIRFVPEKPSKTLAVFMHPATTLQLLPMPKAMAELQFRLRETLQAGGKERMLLPQHNLPDVQRLLMQLFRPNRLARPMQHRPQLF